MIVATKLDLFGGLSDKMNLTFEKMWEEISILNYYNTFLN